MSEADDFVERLKKDLENAKPVDFERRLEILTILYAWTTKKFERRYPLHYRAWDTKQENAG